MITAYKKFWTRSFDFKGKSDRGDYWWAYLANLIVYFLTIFLDGFRSPSGESFLFFGTYVVLSILPMLSIGVRRIRHSGKSWLWIFIQFIPIIGGFWFIYLLAQPPLAVG